MFRHLLISATLLFSLSANASMYFEPLVGYGKGSSTSSDVSTSTYISPSVGFKFGYFVDYVYVVLDTRYSILNFTEGTTATSPFLTNLGLSIGWDWNLPIRTYYTLDIMSDYEINGLKVEGTGSRFGIGYYLTLDTLMSLEFVSSKGSATIGATDIDVNFSYTMLVFSFPIEFMYPQTSWKNKVRQ